ncbi:NEP1-interacting protein 1-like isoform X1 [Ananas comosus]|uniref:NEP1-interacting protein 1-like isoform X1 n=1 Tax=Ananas comosus TaxID=4615 RepID=A0A6P5HME5_ANACO|nr:NEP1-interacting protein 1-like isoform X1 [Ananas comosus]
MEVISALPHASSPPNTFSSYLSGINRGASTPRRTSRPARLLARLIRALITCIFATVGLFLGAVTGGLIGLATESGVFRGSGTGAITGVLVSLEVVDSSLALWRNNESGIWSILYVIDIICSLLSGRLVREKVDPTVQSAVQSQMNAVDSPFREALDIFETGGSNGMAKASIEKLPEIEITVANNVDSSGDRIRCSVCLQTPTIFDLAFSQDLQVGEAARSLPSCQHKFHLPCIDGWLLMHGSCPLCRRDLLTLSCLEMNSFL